MNNGKNQIIVSWTPLLHYQGIAQHIRTVINNMLNPF